MARHTKLSINHLAACCSTGKRDVQLLWHAPPGCFIQLLHSAQLACDLAQNMDQSRDVVTQWVRHTIVRGTATMVAQNSRHLEKCCHSYDLLAWLSVHEHRLASAIERTATQPRNTSHFASGRCTSLQPCPARKNGYVQVEQYKCTSRPAASDLQQSGDEPRLTLPIKQQQQQWPKQQHGQSSSSSSSSGQSSNSSSNTGRSSSNSSNSCRCFTTDTGMQAYVFLHHQS